MNDNDCEVAFQLRDTRRSGMSIFHKDLNALKVQRLSTRRNDWRKYTYICGITPTTIIMVSVLFCLAAVSAAAVNKRFWGDNSHFESVDLRR